MTHNTSLCSLPDILGDQNYEPLSFDPNDLTPGIVHIGWGRFARAFINDFLTALASRGARDVGIIAVVPSARQERLLRQLKEQQYVYTLIKRNGDETLTAVGALRDFLIGKHDPAAVISLLARSSTRLVTLTITQVGYCVDEKKKLDMSNEIISDISAIRKGDYASVKTVPGWLTAGLYERYKQKQTPFTVISCDNVPRNGDIIHGVIHTFAEQIDPSFAQYIKDEAAFPNSVVDRVTPEQNYDLNRRHLKANYDIEDRGAVICEPHKWWIINKNFPAKYGQFLEDVGIRLVPSVEPYEKMKLSLFNGCHLALGVTGKLLQIPTVHDAMHDPQIRPFILAFLEEATNGLKTNIPIPVDDYSSDTVTRLDNPCITDPIRRLLSSTAGKVKPRLFNSAALERNLPHNASAFAIAAWLRYMQGVDESGNVYALSPGDEGRLQKLGLTDTNSIRQNLPLLLAKDEITAPSLALKAFVDNVIEYYRLIGDRGLRDSLEMRFTAQPHHPPRRVFKNKAAELNR